MRNAFLLLILIFPAIQSCQKSQIEKPNIILIVTDDLDFDEVNFYPLKDFPSFTGSRLNGLKNFDPFGTFNKSGQLMPNLDQMAKEGMIFSRFYTTSSVCTPVRYACLTGNYAARSKFLERIFPKESVVNINWNTYLCPEENNIAKELKKLGYKTAMIGKWHNGMNGRLVRIPRSVNDLNNKDTLVKIQRDYSKLKDFITKELGFDCAEAIHYDNPAIVNLEWITENVISFIQKNREKPFFMYIAPPLPHCQYTEPDFWNPLATPAGWLKEAPKGQKDFNDAKARIKAKNLEPRKAMGTWLDYHFGAIVETLKKYKLDKNTLIIITSDQQTRGKYTCYETCRVPTIAWWPGTIEKGSKTDFFTADIDLFPTFIELAGGKPPKVDGVSFAGLLRKNVPAPTERKYLMLEIAYSRAIVTKDWKLIANRPPDSIFVKMNDEAVFCSLNKTVRRIGWDGVAGEPNFHHLWGTRYGNDYFFPGFFDKDQLYDLKTDIFEQNNLYNDPKFQTQKLKLSSYMREVLSTFRYCFGEFQSK